MTMHKNKFWLALLFVIMSVMLWYGGLASYKLYDYYTLSEKSTAVIAKWSVKKLNGEDFRVHAVYTYNVDGKIHSGETTFTDEKFLNPRAAERAIPDYANKKWIVSYQPKKEHHSTLQKKLPLKECISAAVLLALLIYFVSLGFYVTRYGK